MIPAELHERRVALALLIAIMLVGLTLAAAGLWNAVLEAGLALTGQTAQGVVSDVRYAHKGRIGSSAFLSYEFTPIGTGTSLQGKQVINGAALNGLRPGQLIEVVYLPALPRYNRTTLATGQAVKTALLIAGGLALTTPGIVILIRAMHARRPG